MASPRGSSLIIGRNHRAHSFRPIPHRWKVERSLAWLGVYRRLSKDYEGTTGSSEAFLQTSFIDLLCNRLAE